MPIITSVNLLCAFMALLGAALPLAALPLRAEQPPLLPNWETAQLYQGCAVQADSYARALKVADPSWSVRLATLVMPNGSKHSVAIATRGDETFIRDNVLGVFPVHESLQTAFDRRIRSWRNDHPLTTPNASSNHVVPNTEKATAAAVEIAEKALNTECERYLVADGRTRFWVVAWTTVDGQKALYHPRIGTTLTKTPGRRESVALAVLRALGCNRPILIGSSQR